MSGLMLKIGALALVYSTLIAALSYYETTIGCGQIPKIGVDGVTTSGAYYCHVIVRPR